jgi:hypothetical protein
MATSSLLWLWLLWPPILSMVSVHTRRQGKPRQTTAWTRQLPGVPWTREWMWVGLHGGRLDSTFLALSLVVLHEMGGHGHVDAL